MQAARSGPVRSQGVRGRWPGPRAGEGRPEGDSGASTVVRKAANTARKPAIIHTKTATANEVRPVSVLLPVNGTRVLFSRSPWGTLTPVARSMRENGCTPPTRGGAFRPLVRTVSPSGGPGLPTACRGPGMVRTRRAGPPREASRRTELAFGTGGACYASLAPARHGRYPEGGSTPGLASRRRMWVPAESGPCLCRGDRRVSFPSLVGPPIPLRSTVPMS